MTHPYEELEASAFWRSAVAERNPLSIRDVWDPKFEIRADNPVSTAGSCFAQAIGRALAARGYNWFDAEPAPSFLPAAARARFNYGIFSFRTSNIYTAAMLRQWMAWALGASKPPREIWHQDGRYFDPFRPTIEPDGFVSEEELLSSREMTLKAIRHAVKRSSVFTFTMGLTEAWMNKREGHVYSSCPGTLRGVFDERDHGFRNFTHSSILGDLTAAFDLARKANPKLRILLTVSPVPITATASGKHALVASTYTKSVLRAVAGEYTESRDYADYFPSYELVTAPPFRGMFYQHNMRSVAPEGVDFVMDVFFQSMRAKYASAPAPLPAAEKRAKSSSSQKQEDDVVCEDALLEEFNEP